MSVARSLRKIHYWASLFLLVSVFVIAGTGSLLALKKDFAALQPPTRTGSRPGLPERTMASLVPSIAAAPGHEGTTWEDIDRIDIRPADGIAKVVLHSRTELQVDLHSGEVLQIGYRTSDLLETIHDFSFVGGWAKYVFSFGSGIALLVMGGTGVYLFVLPFLARRAKRRGKREG
jgi:uncharacterized iron-regulated membrane protein